MRILAETNTRLLSLGILLLRCVVGVILFAIGAGKVLGWFGGYGLTKTIQAYVTMMGIPMPFAYLSSFTEFIGGFLLIIGLFTRPAAFAVMINMLIAFIVTLPKGFLAGGAAYPFSLMVSAIIIQLAGPMAYSLDSWLLQPGEVIHELRAQGK